MICMPKHCTSSHLSGLCLPSGGTCLYELLVSQPVRLTQEPETKTELFQGTVSLCLSLTDAMKTTRKQEKIQRCLGMYTFKSKATNIATLLVARHQTTDPKLFVDSVHVDPQ